jgi:hypothetical protein
LDYAPDLGRLEVPDPYYGDASAFEEVLDLSLAASRGLIAALHEIAQQPVQAAGERDGDGQREHPGHQ